MLSDTESKIKDVIDLVTSDGAYYDYENDRLMVWVDEEEEFMQINKGDLPVFASPECTNDNNTVVGDRLYIIRNICWIITDKPI